MPRTVVQNRSFRLGAEESAPHLSRKKPASPYIDDRVKIRPVNDNLVKDDTDGTLPCPSAILGAGIEGCSQRSPRILIVRVSAIGDVIHGIPVLCALREAFPSAFLAWVAEGTMGDVLDGHPAR